MTTAIYRITSREPGDGEFATFGDWRYYPTAAAALRALDGCEIWAAATDTVREYRVEQAVLSWEAFDG